MRSFIVAGACVALIGCNDPNESIGYQRAAAIAGDAGPQVEALGALDLAATSDTGASDSDNLTNARTARVTGTATPGRVVFLYCDDRLLATTFADADGRFTKLLSWNASTVEDQYFWTAFADDGTTIDRSFTARAWIDGVLGPASPALVVTFDYEAPPPPSAPRLDPSCDTGTPDDDYTSTSERNLILEGTSDVDGPIEISAPPYEDEPIVIFATTAAQGGRYAASGWLDVFAIDGVLRELAYVLVARVTDAAGNTSAPSENLQVQYDTKADAPSLIARERFGALEVTATVESDVQEVIFAALDGDGAPVAVLLPLPGQPDEVASTSLSQRVVESGEMGARTHASTVQARELPDGVYYLTAIAVDRAGNRSALPAVVLEQAHAGEASDTAQGTGYVRYVWRQPEPVACESVLTHEWDDVESVDWLGRTTRAATHTITGLGCEARVLDADDARLYCSRQHGRPNDFASLVVTPFSVEALAFPITGFSFTCTFTW